jgi:hypothetical protein
MGGRRLIAAAGVAALALAAAAGCGGESEGTAADVGSPENAASSGSVDPCALVSAAEAAAAMGVPSVETERPSEANLPPRLVTCRYVAPRGQGVAVLVVMVRIGSETESRTAFDSVKAQFTDAAPADGLTGDAFVIWDQLHVLKGPFYLQLSGDVSAEARRDLARTALDRLG